MTTTPLTYIEIDRDALVQNLQAVKKHVGVGVQVMPVVKANAYGHGALEVARTLESAGAPRLAVNRVEEGIALRQGGITLPILVMGYALAEAMPSVAEHNLTPTLTEIETAKALEAAVDHEIDVHVKVDTGMGRFGLLPDEVLAFVRELSRMSRIRVAGIYTHFSAADSITKDDKQYTQEQIRTFQRVLQLFAAAGIIIPLRHAANSAGVMYYPEAHFDVVRPGICIYGLRPNAALDSPFELKPALAIKSHVARVRTLPKGSSISYGRTYITKKPTLTALIPVGYGDGYHRLISNRGAVLIRGKRAPVIGRVCMDQFVVDVSQIPDTSVDDEVVLLGRQGNAEISADEIAGWAETINYEVTTALLPRATRIYRP